MFTADDKQFCYAGLTPAGTVGLYLVDPLTFKMTLLYDDPQYDIENLRIDTRWLISDDGESLLAFEYMADRPAKGSRISGGFISCRVPAGRNDDECFVGNAPSRRTPG